jgi:soluble lytic murein transglycosylase-like protein
MFVGNYNYGSFGIPQFSSQEAQYQNIISAMAESYAVPEDLIKSVIATESSWNPNARRPEPKKNDASVGLMQVLLGTGKEILNNPNLTEVQLFTPYTNIQTGTIYLAKQAAKFDNPADIYAAYNAGGVYHNADGTYVNQANVNNFIKWYQLYTTRQISPAYPSKPGVQPTGPVPSDNTWLYIGVGVIGILGLSLVLLATKKKSTIIPVSPI